MIPHNRPTYGEDEERAVAACVHMQAVGKAGDGRIVENFEWALADWYGVKNVVCVGSGREAIRCAVEDYLGGSLVEAITVPAYSCEAIREAIETHYPTSPMDIGETNGDFTINTFGVPHTAGAIEDLTHGGTELRGDMGITSFGATKLLGAGQGGAVLSNLDLDEIRKIRLTEMSDLHASVGLVQLSKLSSMIAKRREIVAKYNEAFSKNFYSVTGYRYILEVEDAAELIFRLSAMVECIRPIIPWCDLTNFPKTQYAYQHNVSLPCYPTLSDTDQDIVIARVNDCR